MLSVVIPCYNEAQTLAVTWPQLAEASLHWDEPCEFIFVDDGSTDATWSWICRLAEEDWRVRGIRLAQNLGQQSAIGIGLSQARGDAVIVLDADLQDPPDLVPRLITAWREGADIVVAVRRARLGEPWWKRWAARLVYRGLWPLATGRTLPDAGDFALYDRRAVRWLLRWRLPRPFWRGMRELGPFRRVYLEFDRPPRQAGNSHYSFWRLYRLAFDGLLGLTAWPAFFAASVFLATVVVLALTMLATFLGMITLGTSAWLISCGTALVTALQMFVVTRSVIRALRQMQIPRDAFVAEWVGVRQGRYGKIRSGRNRHRSLPVTTGTHWSRPASMISTRERDRMNKVPRDLGRPTS
ncbi:MAG: glycosyltransferase family 2 protein [Gemmatales bacterium]|nr:glycosyltransferase family 2 protein [Gemmatales bacterium]MDW7995394.1 glycosyltransferase family 2 protein [Gemmatales bacterium]